MHVHILSTRVKGDTLFCFILDTAESWHFVEGSLNQDYIELSTMTVLVVGAEGAGKTSVVQMICEQKDDNCTEDPHKITSSWLSCSEQGECNQVNSPLDPRCLAEFPKSLSSLYIHLLDINGQPSCPEIFPLFLRCPSFCIFTLNLTEILDEHPFIKFLNNNAYHSHKQALKMFVSSMQSIWGDRVPLLIVGTQSDRASECSETVETKNKQLDKMGLPSFVCSSIPKVPIAMYPEHDVPQMLLPVDSKSPNEIVLDEIREQIVKKSIPEKQVIPVKLYEVLQDMEKATGRTILSKEECLKAATCSTDYDKESFEFDLKCLHRSNVICYFESTLPDTVFCNPQLIVNMISDVLKYKLSNQGHFMAKPEEKLSSYGIVNDMILSELFQQHYHQNVFTQTKLVELFTTKCVIFPTVSKSEYLMPCLLPVLDFSQIREHQVDSFSPVAPLLLYFSQGPCYGLFWKTIASLLISAKWEIQQKSKKPSCLFRNCVTCTIPTFAATVTLIDSFTHYEVHLRAKHDHLSSNTCVQIRKIILLWLEDSALSLQDTTHHCSPEVPELAVFCPCGKDDAHPAVVKLKQRQWKCTRNPGDYNVLNERDMLWFNQDTPKGIGTLNRI